MLLLSSISLAILSGAGVVALGLIPWPGWPGEPKRHREALPLGLQHLVRYVLKRLQGLEGFRV